MKLPRCPRENCRGKSEQAGSLYRCTKCRSLHDGVPDEGGDFSDRDPSARLQRQERVKPPTRARTSW
jgi:hypothetical protein